MRWLLALLLCLAGLPGSAMPAAAAPERPAANMVHHRHCPTHDAGCDHVCAGCAVAIAVPAGIAPRVRWVRATPRPARIAALRPAPPGLDPPPPRRG